MKKFDLENFIEEYEINFSKEEDVLELTKMISTLVLMLGAEHYSYVQEKSNKVSNEHLKHFEEHFAKRTLCS